MSSRKKAAGGLAVLEHGQYWPGRLKAKGMNAIGTWLLLTFTALEGCGQAGGVEQQQEQGDP